ncbi:MAG: hypothetical protein ABII13_03900 [Patescibacteria group bacterium]|nr:hypothetical protein [Patescibacteria group bacterium]MBU2509513.1 hypothetical protein [Patescibacteria group bacterium]
MKSEIILKQIPNADPEFLKIMEKQPEPSDEIREKVVDALPKLHDLFLKKRNAALCKDEQAFMSLVEQEVALLEKIG